MGDAIGSALLQRVCIFCVHILGLGPLETNVLPNVNSTCKHCLKAQGSSIALHLFLFLFVNQAMVQGS